MNSSDNNSDSKPPKYDLTGILDLAPDSTEDHQNQTSSSHDIELPVLDSSASEEGEGFELPDLNALSFELEPPAQEYSNPLKSEANREVDQPDPPSPSLILAQYPAQNPEFINVNLDELSRSLPSPPSPERSDESKAPPHVNHHPESQKLGLNLPFENVSSDYSDAMQSAQIEAQIERPAQSGTIDQVRDFADNLSVGKSLVQAAFGFNLSITGNLTKNERETLIDLISRENMGFRELDIEPQLEAGRILLPRISEFAGVLIIQALRSARVQISFYPSDQLEVIETRPTQTYIYDPIQASGAEELPLTSLPCLPGNIECTAIDVISASAALKSRAVEAENSLEYQELVQALQKEIKYKAFRRGADAVVNFTVSLTQLSVPTHYRVMASGAAVKKKLAPIV